MSNPRDLSKILDGGGEILVHDGADIGLSVTGNVSQSSSLQEWKLSDGTVVSKVTVDGIEGELGGTLSDYGEKSQDLGDVSGVVDIDISLGQIVYMKVVGPITSFNILNPSNHKATSFLIFLETDGSDINWLPAVGGWFGSKPDKFISGYHVFSFSLLDDAFGIIPDNNWWVNYKGSIVLYSAVPFEMTVRTDFAGDTFKLPFRTSYNYNCEVDWGDGSTSQVAKWDDSSTLHTYSVAGDYQISITGIMETLFFSNGGDKDKVISIDAWGDTGLISLEGAFWGCTKLISVADGNTTLGNTSNCKYFEFAFSGCTSLISFPLIDTSNAYGFTETWSDCVKLQTMAEIDTSKAVDLQYAWYNCSSLTSFPKIDTSNVLVLFAAWSSCSSLTSFPEIDTSNAEVFNGAWQGCTGLTDFPLIDTSKGLYFNTAWQFCTGLTNFPKLDFTLAVSLGGYNQGAWQGCTGLTSFPDISFWNNVDTFANAWNGCTSLSSFPSVDAFDACINTRDYEDAFTDTNLTAGAKENILVSINTANQTNGTLDITGGQALNQAGIDAKDNLEGSKGWTLDVPETMMVMEDFEFESNHIELKFVEQEKRIEELMLEVEALKSKYIKMERDYGIRNSKT